ncbi:MAG: hypothetical protein IT381_14215 [Deltaproteobacteria bacterium]|nr:hypothetical protein [Deltaproteobacteria bacterium]
MQNGGRIVLSRFVPGKVPAFEVTKVGDGVAVTSNVDFKSIPLHADGRGALSPAHVLSELASFGRLLRKAAQHDAELFVDETGAQLLKARAEHLFRAVSKSKTDMAAFGEHALDGATNVRDAINDGRLSFSSFLDALDGAAKFKEWLKGRPGDAKLLSEFVQEVTRSQPLDKLGNKGLKFLLFGGLSLLTGGLLSPEVGAAAGLALGAADTFFFDKLINRWTPGAFIEDLRQKVAPRA